ncbi:hypothetical protein VB780_08345 [Leptolyngbya sp. CCNP1308]|uniref:hypothetical protein n=1 Tax=Leptolyngbya sp. CCNP1308 TaxID=3110255 RepID=UPI002B1F9DD0|nr:hypothetical protein [Leptolyngbya sp. CCNP1308]MEA5448570.1 hypothetical protein [Leptolyngbya sp. CCNP1308]
MYSSTLSAIANAADFLTYFRKLPRNQQDMIAPHLDAPQRMALRVLNCCSELEGQSVGAIANLAELHQESTRAILKSLEGRMVAAEVTAHGKLWKLS